MSFPSITSTVPARDSAEHRGSPHGCPAGSRHCRRWIDRARDAPGAGGAEELSGPSHFSRRNRGLGAARDAAIRCTTSKFILPVDSDNCIRKTYLSDAPAGRQPPVPASRLMIHSRWCSQLACCWSLRLAPRTSPRRVHRKRSPPPAPIATIDWTAGASTPAQIRRAG